MVPAEHRELNVALIAHRDARTGPLRNVLEAGGISVALTRRIDACEAGEILAAIPDVLLVDLDGMGSRQLRRLEELIETSEVPILFTEGGTPGEAGWGETIVRKLKRLAESQARNDETIRSESIPRTATVSATETDSAVAAASQRDSAAYPDSRGSAPPGVWILGASLGGPQALSEFLAALPGSLPVSIIVAQHIGESFAPLFVEQLGRTTPLPVSLAEDLQPIRSGEVILAPADRRFTVDGRGFVLLDPGPIPCAYKPCVNDVMQQVATCFGPDTGGIIFSGMGEDGAEGCRYIAEQGGVVWAQSEESCVISSMPDAARATGTVSLSATPEQLAACLVQTTRELESKKYR